MRVAVAGVTGALGRAVARAAKARGAFVIGLARDASRVPDGACDEVRVVDAMSAPSLAGAFEGVEAAFSSVGASVQPALGLGWRGYTHVDVVATRNLVEAAKASRVGRFVYVSVAHVPAMRQIAYVRAHEQAAASVVSSGMSSCIVRPTGFFSAIGALVPMAAKGPLPVFGDGKAESNPIDDDDLARLCAEQLEGDTKEVEAGGPEVLSRTRMSELAFEALGKEPRLRAAPIGVLRAAGACIRPFHPRLGQGLQFYASLGACSVVVEKVGKRTLGEHFRAEAKRLGLA